MKLLTAATVGMEVECWHAKVRTEQYMVSQHLQVGHLHNIGIGISNTHALSLLKCYVAP